MNNPRLHSLVHRALLAGCGLAWLATSQRALALSCAALDVAQAARSADVVFEGDILDRGELVYFPNDQGELERAFRYEVAANRYFKGHVGTQVALHIPIELHSFGVPTLGPDRGRLIFAFWYHGLLAVSECNGTFRKYEDWTALGPGASPVPLDGPGLPGCSMRPDANPSNRQDWRGLAWLAIAGLAAIRTLGQARSKQQR